MSCMDLPTGWLCSEVFAQRTAMPLHVAAVHVRAGQAFALKVPHEFVDGSRTSVNVPR